MFSLFRILYPYLVDPGWWFQNVSCFFSTMGMTNQGPRQGAESLADSPELIQLLRAQRRKLRPLVATCRSRIRYQQGGCQELWSVQFMLTVIHSG